MNAGGRAHKWQSLDDGDWRVITFQGEMFPPSLMGISILEAVLDIEEEELGDWLWRLPICKGCTKTAAAERCARCATDAMNLMLERRPKVLEGIAERLADQGFDPEITYREWIVSLQHIAELSARAEECCEWSAPRHATDASAAEAKQFMDYIDSLLEKAEQEHWQDP